MSVIRAVRRHLPLALLVLIAGLVLPCCVLLRPVLVGHQPPSLQPRSPTDHRRLAGQIGQLINAPAGATILLAADEHELESFLNYEALPRASLGVLRVGVAFHPQEAQFALLFGDSVPLVEVHTKDSNPDEGPELEITDLRLGSLPAPPFLESLLSRVLNDSLAAGDLGVTPLSLALGEGEAQLVLNRR